MVPHVNDDWVIASSKILVATNSFQRGLVEEVKPHAVFCDRCN